MANGQIGATGATGGAGPAAVPPLAGVAGATGATGATGVTLTDCPSKTNGENWTYNHYFAPLKVHKDGILAHDQTTKAIVPYQLAVECFFGGNNTLQPLSQVQYYYGLGTSPSTISANLVALNFPGGLQVALGSSLTGGSTGASGATGATGSTGSTGAQAASGSTTPTQAVQQLETGGDFYILGTYPLLFKPTNHTTSLAVFNPKIGFNIQGFGAQNTITQATEYNWNESVEIYEEYRAFSSNTDPGGALYVDFRGGLQGVQGSFARSIGITGKTEFGLAQVSMGVIFNGFLRVGFQRFFGPSQFYTTTSGTPATSQSDFGKWHLVLQLSPHG
jgi:hypothetical protein